MYFSNVSCQNTNRDYIVNKMTVGGCFRMQNVLSIKINNMTIKNCFSRSTTVGLKIIDDENTIKSLRTNYIGNSSLVFFSLKQ